MSSAERIAELFGAHAIRDGIFRGNCPNCGGDSGTKFSIKDAGDRVLIHCHGGCRFEDIIRALGINAGELFDSPRPKPDPERERQAKIRRGLEIWSQRRLRLVLHVAS